MANGGGPTDYLTTKQAADLIGITDSRLRQILNDEERRLREFPGVTKFGNAWMLPRATVEAYAALERKAGFPLGTKRKKRDDDYAGVFRGGLTFA